MTVSWESILDDIDAAKKRLAELAGEPDMADAVRVAATPHRCIQRALERDSGPDGPEAA